MYFPCSSGPPAVNQVDSLPPLQVSKRNTARGEIGPRRGQRKIVFLVHTFCNFGNFHRWICLKLILPDFPSCDEAICHTWRTGEIQHQGWHWGNSVSGLSKSADWLFWVPFWVLPFWTTSRWFGRLVNEYIILNYAVWLFFCAPFLLFGPPRW